MQIYADAAKSGTNSEREQFQEMIRDSAKKKFRYLIIHKLDRFSRDKFDSVTYKRKMVPRYFVWVGMSSKLSEVV